MESNRYMFAAVNSMKIKMLGIEKEIGPIYPKKKINRKLVGSKKKLDFIWEWVFVQEKNPNHSIHIGDIMISQFFIFLKINKNFINSIFVILLILFTKCEFG